MTSRVLIERTDNGDGVPQKVYQAGEYRISGKATNTFGTGSPELVFTIKHGDVAFDFGDLLTFGTPPESFTIKLGKFDEVHTTLSGATNPDIYYEIIKVC